MCRGKLIGNNSTSSPADISLGNVANKLFFLQTTKDSLSACASNSFRHSFETLPSVECIFRYQFVSYSEGRASAKLVKSCEYQELGQ